MADRLRPTDGQGVVPGERRATVRTKTVRIHHPDKRYFDDPKEVQITLGKPIGQSVFWPRDFSASYFQRSLSQPLDSATRLP